MTDDGPQPEPTGAEWRRLALGSIVSLLVTLAFGAFFLWVMPFPPLVRVILVSPPILFSGWLLWVAVRRDTERFRRFNAFAERRGGGRS